MTSGARRHPDDSLRAVAEAQPGLQLLVLYGSRARGAAHDWSDWDFAYDADARFHPDRLLAALAEHLRAERIDLVDLTRAGRS